MSIILELRELISILFSYVWFAGIKIRLAIPIVYIELGAK